MSSSFTCLVLPNGSPFGFIDDQHRRIVKNWGWKIHELLALRGLVQADIADLVPLFELVIVPGDVGDSPAMGVLWQVLDDDVGDLVLVALSFVLALVDEKGGAVASSQPIESLASEGMDGPNMAIAIIKNTLKCLKTKDMINSLDGSSII